MSMAEKLRALTSNALSQQQNRDHEAAERKKQAELQKARDRQTFLLKQEDESFRAEQYLTEQSHDRRR